MIFLGIETLQSYDDIRPNELVTVNIRKKNGEATLLVDRQPPVKSRRHVTHPVYRTHLFIGGYDRQNIQLASGIGTDAGFKGCIVKV